MMGEKKIKTVLVFEGEEIEMKTQKEWDEDVPRCNDCGGENLKQVRAGKGEGTECADCGQVEAG